MFFLIKAETNDDCQTADGSRPPNSPDVIFCIFNFNFKNFYYLYFNVVKKTLTQTHIYKLIQNDIVL